MFSINILCFVSNFSFNGDTLYRLIPSGARDLFIPRTPDSLMGGYNITGHRPRLVNQIIHFVNEITSTKHLFLHRLFQIVVVIMGVAFKGKH